MVRRKDLLEKPGETRCQEDVHIQDGFAVWVKANFETVLERHVVDVRKSHAEFREASTRKHDTSYQVYHFDNSLPDRSSVKKRLDIYNWNPRPNDEGMEPFRRKLRRSGTSSRCREAIEYVDHQLRTNRFHVTHSGGCAVLFNKDTFPDVKVKSVYLNEIRRVLPDKVVEKRIGLGDTRRAVACFFRRQPLSSLTSFTVMSPYQPQFCQET